MSLWWVVERSDASPESAVIYFMSEATLLENGQVRARLVRGKSSFVTTLDADILKRLDAALVSEEKTDAQFEELQAELQAGVQNSEGPG